MSDQATARDVMAPKMQVLRRKTDATATPRVTLNPSMSLSFALPASMLQKLQQQNPKSSSSELSPPPSHPSTVRHNDNAREQDDDEEEEDSWESRDFDSAAPLLQDDAASRSSTGAASLRILGEDDWLDDAEAPALGDDFPVLVVNLTRLRDEHLGVDAAADVSLDSDDALRAFYHQVKSVLHAHWTHLTDALFEQQIAVHTTYGQHRATLEALHRAAPTHVLALVDYPPELAGLALHEYLHVLSAPTRWPSVNALKDCLRRCSRDLEWKFEIALELERLATDEHERCRRERDALSAEIDDLVRLRDSFRAKLDATSMSSTRYLLLRKLEDLERRLSSRLDAFLAEPATAAAPTDREIRELEQFFRPTTSSATSTTDETAAAPAQQLQNVLDMVIAMILSRLPWDIGSQPTQEAHFELLLERHLHLRQLWKRDFGRLPKRKNADGEEVEDEEEEEAEEQEEALAENWELLEEDAEEEEEEEVDEDEELEEEEETSVVQEKAKTEENDRARVSEETTTAAAMADGYSGDYESDESDDEMAATLRTPLRTEPVVRRRRVRVSGEKPKQRKHPSEEKPKATVVALGDERKTKTKKEKKEKRETQETSQENEGTEKAKSKKEKKSKKKKSSSSKTTKKKKKRDEDATEEPFFQPFACTGALGLLRLAKENEMF